VLFFSGTAGKKRGIIWVRRKNIIWMKCWRSRTKQTKKERPLVKFLKDIDAFRLLTNKEGERVVKSWKKGKGETDRLLLMIAC